MQSSKLINAKSKSLIQNIMCFNSSILMQNAHVFNV